MPSSSGTEQDAVAAGGGYLEYWREVWSDDAFASAGYDTVSAGERNRIDTLASLLPADTGTILDVGCGGGLVANRLADLGHAVTGLDVSTDALRHVRCPAIHGSVDALPVADRAFDVVILADVLEHLQARVFEKSLEEIERVAGRYVIVNSPHAEPLALGRTLCTRCCTAFHSSRHVRSIVPAVLESWLPGFQLVRWELCGEPRRRRIVWLQLAAQTFASAWYRKPRAVCPNCGYTFDPPSPRRFLWALNGGIQRLAGALLPSRPSEFVALLRRR